MVRNGTLRQERIKLGGERSIQRREILVQILQLDRWSVIYLMIMELRLTLETSVKTATIWKTAIILETASRSRRYGGQERLGSCGNEVRLLFLTTPNDIGMLVEYNVIIVGHIPGRVKVTTGGRELAAGIEITLNGLLTTELRLLAEIIRSWLRRRRWRLRRRRMELRIRIELIIGSELGLLLRLRWVKLWLRVRGTELVNRWGEVLLVGRRWHESIRRLYVVTLERWRNEISLANFIHVYRIVLVDATAGGVELWRRQNIVRVVSQFPFPLRVVERRRRLLWRQRRWRLIGHELGLAFRETIYRSGLVIGASEYVYVIE